MGVSQLLRELRPCLVDSHVKEYKGKTVVIDGNAFIFRGSYCCSEQVATGQPCTGPVEYVLKRVHMLEHFGVIPWVVLDGRRTPMKEETNSARQAQREKNLSIALDFKGQANSAPGSKREELLEKARSFFQKSIHVTRQMVTNAVEALKRAGVKCTVAPYEADAQVAFLVKCGLASAVITEDSDILVYMAAMKSTAPLLYKMDEFGACKQLAFDPLNLSSLPGTIGKFGRGLSAFAGEGGGRLFVQLATLAGCDYVDNVKGLGLLTALPVIVKFKCIPADNRVKQVLTHLQRKGKKIPDGHHDRMLRAELSFFWHRVYDPRSETCVHFCSAFPDLVDTAEVPALSLRPGGGDFLGEHIADGLIGDLADGKVDPVTGAPVAAEPMTSSGGPRRFLSLPPNREMQQRPPGTPGRSSALTVMDPSSKWSSRPRQDWRQARLGQDHRPTQTELRGVGSPRSKDASLSEDTLGRATPKAQREGQNPSDDSRRLQDVSEIVVAYGTVRQTRPEAPFGNNVTQAAHDHSASGPANAKARPIRSADAWSCLRQDMSSGVAFNKPANPEPAATGERARAIFLEGTTWRQRPREADVVEESTPAGTKRLVSNTGGGNGGATMEGKGKKSRRTSAGSNSPTLLSFFRRTTKA